MACQSKYISVINPAYGRSISKWITVKRIIPDLTDVKRFEMPYL